jgi:tetratricopeptide (TPR) repeat protein
VYNTRRQWPQALADFIKATELGPQDAWAWGQRAEFRSRMGKPDEALAAYMKAIEAAQRAGQNPAYYWQIRARLSWSFRQWDKAIADSTQAIDLDPKQPLNWATRGDCYRDKGDTQKALADYDMVIKNSAHLPQLARLGFCRRAELNEKLGRWDKVIADWTGHVRVNPADWYGREVLVRVLVTCPDRALRDPRRAIEIAKQDPPLGPEVVGFYLAMAHAQLGNHDEAQMWYDRTVQCMEKNAGNRRGPTPPGQAEAKELLAAQKKKQ